MAAAAHFFPETAAAVLLVVAAAVAAAALAMRIELLRVERCSWRRAQARACGRS